MKINLIYNSKIPDYDKSLEAVKKELENKGADFRCFEIENMQNYGDFTITLGGDGTILKTARFYSERQVPVLGINMGRLGFLSQSEEIPEIINSVLNNEFYTEERLMLESSDYIALNDFVIKGCIPSKASKFYLEINGKTVCDYIADGIIISTPTGSTAYCLSSGGPVLYPSIEAVVIVPICPHTLNARPLVVPANETITVKTADKLLSVAIDGYDTINCVDKITLKTSGKKALLAFLKERQFYSVLRNKLHWGLSPEN